MVVYVEPLGSITRRLRGPVLSGQNTVVYTWTPKVCRIVAFKGLGLLFYLLLGGVGKDFGATVA